MSDYLIAIVIIIIIIIIIIIAFWYLLCKVRTIFYQALFLPSHKVSWLPSNDGYAYKSLYLPINNNNIYYNSQSIKDYDGRYGPVLNVWHFDQFNKNRKKGQLPTTIVFYHGNSGNISQRKYVVDICHRFHIDLILVDYRGYGLSTGESTSNSIYEDGYRTYRYAKSQVPEQNIIVWGESLGGTIACQMAHSHKPRALILMSTFSSIRNVILNQKDIKGIMLPHGAKLFMANLYEKICHPMSSIDTISEVNIPTVIIHSKEDSFIPYNCAERMFNNIKHDNKLFLPIDGDHSSPRINDMTLKAMFAFIGIQSNCRDHDLDYISTKLQTVGEDYKELLG